MGARGQLPPANFNKFVASESHYVDSKSEALRLIESFINKLIESYLPENLLLVSVYLYDVENRFREVRVWLAADSAYMVVAGQCGLLDKIVMEAFTVSKEFVFYDIQALSSQGFKVAKLGPDEVRSALEAALSPCREPSWEGSAAGASPEPSAAIAAAEPEEALKTAGMSGIEHCIKSMTILYAKMARGDVSVEAKDPVNLLDSTGVVVLGRSGSDAGSDYLCIVSAGEENCKYRIVWVLGGEERTFCVGTRDDVEKIIGEAVSRGFQLRLLLDS